MGYEVMVMPPTTAPGAEETRLHEEPRFIGIALLVKNRGAGARGRGLVRRGEPRR